MFILCAVKQIFRGLIIDSTRLDSSRSRMWGFQVFNHLGIECWGFIILGPLFIISLLTAGVRLPRSKIADAPRRVPHQKKFKKTKSCWGPLFIILIKRAGAGSRFHHLGPSF